MIQKAIFDLMKEQFNTSKFIKDPQLDPIETRFSIFSRQVFDKHTHETYAIGLVHQGKSRALLQGELKDIQKGDTIYIPPGAVHACNPVRSETLIYHMFYIDRSLFAEMSNYLFQRVDPGFSATVLHRTSVYQNFNNLLMMMSNNYDRLEKQSQLYQTISIILRLINTHEITLPPTREESQYLKQAHEFLMDHLDRNISLDELASQAGLSPYHFIRVFREVYGLTPHAYRLQKRIQAARKLIAGGTSIAQVACQMGFTDQSHFTRRFKAYVGMTPNEFQHSLQHF